MRRAEEASCHRGYQGREREAHAALRYGEVGDVNGSIKIGVFVKPP